jgi:hypothetical protein
MKRGLLTKKIYALFYETEVLLIYILTQICTQMIVDNKGRLNYYDIKKMMLFQLASV